MDWIKTILPTIGALLVPGGPMIGAAVEAVGKALGLSDATEKSIKDTLASGRLTPDAMQSLRKADNELKLKLEELGIKAEELSIKDRGDARAMQINTGSWVPSTLACAVTVGYFAILIGLMSHKFELANSEGLTILLGSLTTAWGSIVAFYYGASHLPQAGEKK